MSKIKKKKVSFSKLYREWLKYDMHWWQVFAKIHEEYAKKVGKI